MQQAAAGQRRQRGQRIRNDAGLKVYVSCIGEMAYGTKCPSRGSDFLYVSFALQEKQWNVKIGDQLIIEPYGPRDFIIKQHYPKEVDYPDSICRSPTIAVSKIAPQSLYPPLKPLEIKLADEDETLKNVEYEQGESREADRTPLQQLPVMEIKEIFIETVKQSQVTIVTASTGSGKSTKLPQMLIDSKYWNGRVEITQPRRLAAESCAKRVAEERNSKIGAEVGYITGGVHCVSSRTRIIFQTEGVLVQKLFAGDCIQPNSVIMLDEAHEMGIELELLLAIIKKLLVNRSDLRLVICSATANAEIFRDFFNAQILEVQGRSYSVEVFYLTKELGNCGTEEDGEPSLIEALCKTLKIIGGHEILGDTLVFLPSADIIEAAYRHIQMCKDLMKVFSKPYRLFAACTQSEKEQAVHSVPPYPKRKLILSTNIAETSITIPTVRFVVDSGLQKQNNFNVEKLVDEFRTVFASKSSIEQRAGRAGRCSNGICYRMYSRKLCDQLDSFPTPQIKSQNMAQLQLRLYGKREDWTTLPFMNFPPEAHIKAADNYLFQLGALDVDYRTGQFILSSLGDQISDLPINPGMAVAVNASRQLCCDNEMLTAAAVLEGQGLFHFPVKDDNARTRKREMGQGVGDIIVAIKYYREYFDLPVSDRRQYAECRYINEEAMHRAKELRTKLKRRLNINQNSETSCREDYVFLQRALSRGFGHNMTMAIRWNGEPITEDLEGVRTKRNRDVVFVSKLTGQNIKIHPSSFVSDEVISTCFGCRLQLSNSELYMMNVERGSPHWFYEDLRKEFFNTDS